MTPHCGAHSTRLQQNIIPLSVTSIRAITNSTELCPVNSALSVTKHYECRCVTFIQKTVCYQSVFFVCMSVRYTHFPFPETSPS